MKFFPTFLLALSICLRNSCAATFESDICVYGGTASGVIAAVQAAKMGKKVVLLEFGKHLGGLSSGGLGFTDIGNKAAVGGLSRKFYQELGKHYGKTEAWVFEPKVAEKEFQRLVQEHAIPVYFEQRLASVRKRGSKISEIQMENGNVFKARMFIDATYEGDLMAQAGVSFHVGREANSVYGETLNGICAQTPKHQFIIPVDPYKIPGDARSGLLPLIQPDPLGNPGAGDSSIQAYNYRLCLTKDPTNRIPITAPANFDPTRYELLARYLDGLVAANKRPNLKQFLKIDMVTADKTDINNNGPFSTDYIGMNHDYANASYARREELRREHENYIRGLLVFLATNPRVPESMRHEMQIWGFCKDEFQDTGGWPHQMYVREARRMIGEYVMTEKNCRYESVIEDSVGLAAYNMDSHNCRRIVRDGKVENEGDVQVPPMKPYPISLRAIVPKTGECQNLLVPVCLSSSHIAYGSIRMEPVFMILGQSAATIAVHALNEKTPVQKVNYSRLRQRLLAHGQLLDWQGGKPTGGMNPGAQELK